ncbi:MAG: ribonuclease HI [Gammaproteobacteria bacterium]|nr:ribonuclease HI [Gammaproteobacteria bacterium]MBT3860678.1 ribonuclease HI [Gammaproteobacteria bacterium]MBT3988340.1 ribonuclease HI [Gammaproteobacteria bacterium]MBT4256387.1 ribonuclease HI [Gammaproteobacteria bacterium]MBT4581968.1 ribonuclease HI [Gammaproteobacteria bacterium]
MFTDGACRGNPGKGGWGVLMRYGDTEKSLYGGDPMTTNNRMELMAVIKGLEALTKPCKVKITSDSKYVLTGITDWINNWKARNWKTANKKPVQNVELWKQLDELAALHDIEWGWVKGHSGHRENEIADDLANLGIDEL